MGLAAQWLMKRHFAILLNDALQQYLSAIKYDLLGVVPEAK
jgi:hypothetical protein